MRRAAPHARCVTVTVTAVAVTVTIVAAPAPTAARAPRARGFTLLEVLVALVVVALGMSALLETLTQSAQNVANLRERTVAEWIAMNQLALARLSLNAPTIGVTQGDVQNCANGNWHWQQSISAVSAIPGLMSITVRVRRTGNATNVARPSNSTHGSADRGSNSTGAAGPGATGQLGPNISLGPTATLGSVTSLSSAGCASLVAAGSSLGPGGAGSPGQTSQSLGASSQLGASSGLAGPSLGNSGSSTEDSSVNGPASAFGGLLLGGGAGAANGSDSGASGGTGSGTGSGTGGSDAQWLATLTGFRGNTLGASVGETPDWAGSQFAGQAGTNGAPSGGTGTTTGNAGPGARFP